MANARVGQQGTLTRVWAKRGTRPRAKRDTRYQWSYIFGAVCPGRAVAAGLVLPFANTEAMNAHLTEIACTVAEGAHAVLVLDGAGWHGSAALTVPDNISLLHLPPRCPELNPTENIWQFICDNWLSNRVFTSHEDILDQACAAWNRLINQPSRITSIGLCDWAHRS